MVRPQIHSGNETWAPSGAEYIGGTIFFAGLRGESLYEAKVEGGRVVAFSRQLQGEYGRLRSVRLGPDGYLYLLTSNRDGRGSPQNDDDRIIRIHPRILR